MRRTGNVSTLEVKKQRGYSNSSLTHTALLLYAEEERGDSGVNHTPLPTQAEMLILKVY
jgi:hypothetical protein